jgi:hypothetical protein
MRMLKKGQGATEYLLMLAAVLVIVAIAVYYITATPVLPAMTMHTALDNVDGPIELRMHITSGTLVADDYKYKVLGPLGFVQDWKDGVTDLTPANSPVSLLWLGDNRDNIEGSWTVKIIYKPADTAYKDFTASIAW